jgi:acetolactate synthase regulatory subunit
VVAEQTSGINDKRRGLWRILRLAERRGFDVRVEVAQDTLPASFEED